MRAIIRVSLVGLALGLAVCPVGADGKDRTAEMDAAARAFLKAYHARDLDAMMQAADAPFCVGTIRNPKTLQKTADVRSELKSRLSTGGKFPTVVAAWRRAWDRVIPFFAFPPSIRRVIYTTNAIESVNARLRKIIKTRGHFPSDDSATKLIWLALRNITEDWTRPTHHWKAAMNQFAILYEDRFTRPAS